MSNKTDSERALPMPGGRPEYLAASLRHFCDLRDRTHGGVSSRRDKERLFEKSVGLLDPHARAVLGEIDEGLLCNTGQVAYGGFVRSPEGAYASWHLSWPEQRASRAEPLALVAHYGAGFHHPHLRGGSLGEWPLNIFSPEDAAAEIPVLRAIAVGELHNLVFRYDYRIVPATARC